VETKEQIDSIVESQTQLASTLVENGADTKTASSFLTSLSSIIPFLSKKNKTQNGALTAIKQADGRYRWVAVYSDTTWDRDKERFTSESHKDFVDWVDKTKNFPDLRIWHIPGTAFGKSDMIDMDSNGYMVATGLIESGKEYVVENLQKSGKVLGVSHGFYFPSLIRGEYSKGYRTFEISVLPWEKAANENTGFFAGEETPMLAPEKKAFIANALGSEFTTKLEATLAEASSKAKEKGVSFKELMETIQNSNTAKEMSTQSEKETESTSQKTTDLSSVKDLLAEFMKEVKTTLSEFSEQIKAIEVSDDEKISKAMSQKAGFNPTTDESTQTNANDKDVKIAKAEMSKKEGTTADGFEYPAHLKEYGALLGALTPNGGN